MRSGDGGILAEGGSERGRCGAGRDWGSARLRSIGVPGCVGMAG